MPKELVSAKPQTWRFSAAVRVLRAARPSVQAAGQFAPQLALSLNVERLMSSRAQRCRGNPTGAATGPQPSGEQL
jgi:hypothetical protein